MASTEITTIDAAGYLALTHDLAEVKSFIEDNLAGQEVSEFDLQRINVPSGKAQKYRFEIPTLEGSEAVDEISGIIVFQKQTRAFWPQSIDEGGGNVPPSCSSPDARHGFGKQWATATDPDPDGDPRRVACASCPNAQFGSDGGRLETEVAARARAYGEALRPTFEAAATAPIQTPEDVAPPTGRNGTEAASTPEA
jgi:hypothetical protein